MKLYLSEGKDSRRLCAKLGFGERFHPKELELLITRQLEVLIPPMAVQGRQGNIIMYDVLPYSNLKFYLKYVLSRAQFSNLVHQCIFLFQELQRFYLEPENLVLEFDHIYISLNDKKLHFVYFPRMSSRHKFSPVKFFKKLGGMVKCDTYEQADYLRQYMEFLNGPTDFSLGKFDDFLHKIPKEPPVKDVVEAYRPPMPSRVIPSVRPDTLPPVIPSVRPDTLAPVIPVRESARKTSETVLLPSASLREGFSGAVLTRVKSGERIILDRPRTLLGQEAQSVDYCISDNPAVSRVHAEITTSGGRYFIKDLNSTNGTRVNQEALSPDTAFMLEDGARVALSNEVFLFSVLRGGKEGTPFGGDDEISPT